MDLISRKAVEWRAIKGFEGIYEVSNDGQIYSIRSNKFMKPSSKSKYGHAQVVLRKNGDITRKQIHRIVAETFIKNPDNKPEVCHISNEYDENGFLNNSVENLRWGTHIENCRYENTRLRQSMNHADFRGTRNPHYGKHLTEEQKKNLSVKKGNQVIQWDGERVIGVYDSLKQAGRETGISWTNIRNVCDGLYKNACGYQWSYVYKIFALVKGGLDE